MQVSFVHYLQTELYSRRCQHSIHLLLSQHGVIGHMVNQTPNEKYMYIGELINGKDFKPVS